MSEELMANHSQEEIAPPEQTEQLETTQTQETPDTTPEIPQAFKVKYNKEEVEVPYDQAPDYIQKGMNYDKVSQRAEEYQNHLNRVAQLTGYQSHEELLQILDEAEKEQERQKYENAGIDPEKFQELVSELPEIQQFREIQKQQEAAKQFEAEANELFGEFPDLTPEQIPPETWQLKESRGITLLDAYLRTTYKSLGQQKEQEAIQKLSQNQQTSPGALGQEGSEHKSSYSQLSAKEKSALRERVLRGENVTF